MALTPGYSVDLMSFLFGNILMVTEPVLWALFLLDLVILLVVAVFTVSFCWFVMMRNMPVCVVYRLRRYTFYFWR